MAIIDLNNISVAFDTDTGSTVNAVRDVNLEINKSDIYGIIGYSGAGKSTLVRTINLLQRPTEGKVTVAGDLMNELTPKQLRQKRKKIGMIFQHFNLLKSQTVHDNIAFPLKNSGLSRQDIDTKVKELLELVGLSDREQAYPSQLSGGQKQRVAIARALANDPEVLLCDEATSALDPKTTGQILNLLQRLNRDLGLTIVIITHEMAVVKQICNRVAVMEDGRVIEEDSIINIFTNPKQPLTKSFINSATRTEDNINEILSHPTMVDLEQDQAVIRLSYVGQSTSSPLVAKMASEHAVEANILFANVEMIQGIPVGTLLISLRSKEDSNIEAALADLAEQDIRITSYTKQDILALRQEVAANV